MTTATRRKGPPRVFPLAMLLSLLLAMATACAPTHDYVIADLPHRVTLEDSAYGAFEYVNVQQDDGRLRVYGKLQRERARCQVSGHVDVAVLGPSGALAYSTSLPLRRQSRRARGWAGAAFRAVLPYKLAEGDAIRLALHDEGCFTGTPFECSDNQAMQATGEPREASDSIPRSRE